MKKYLHVLNIGIQNQLVYRVNFLFRALFSLLPLIATISLWRTVYASQEGSIGGYTLAQMISYYLLVTVIEATTSVTEDDWQIATDIKDGHISQFLTRPMDYLHYRLWLFFSGRAVYTLAAFVPVSLFVLWNHEYLLAPPSATAFGVFLISLALSALLQFFLSYLIAMLAFWVLEISTFVFILLAFERLASGQMFPLDILPAWLSGALMWTPFPYAIFYPASVYMGGISGAAMFQGLGMQLFWVCATYVLARTVWRQGLKSYTVVGG